LLKLLLLKLLLLLLLQRTWSGLQKMCASSCTKRRTRVRPDSAPLYSLRCSTPKSASRSGSSLAVTGQWVVVVSRGRTAQQEPGV
jgi:hypothetical protein